MNSELRREFSEHLLLEDAAGLRDDQWLEQTHAFLNWCWRQDNEPTPEVKCQDCDHPKHVGKGCGHPIKGEFPYLKACLCQSTYSTGPQREAIAISCGDLRFTFEWIDKATDHLRRLQARLPLGDADKKMIAELIKGTKFNPFSGGR